MRTMEQLMSIPGCMLYWTAVEVRDYNLTKDEIKERASIEHEMLKYDSSGDMFNLWKLEIAMKRLIAVV